MIEAFEKLSLTSSQYYGEISSGQFSQHLIDTPPIRKIDSLIVTNFKSFSNSAITQRERSTWGRCSISPQSWGPMALENQTSWTRSCSASATSVARSLFTTFASSSTETETRPTAKCHKRGSIAKWRRIS